MKTTNVQEKWLGTLTSVPNERKKVPRHAPACLISCAADIESPIDTINCFMQTHSDLNRILAVELISPCKTNTVVSER